MQVGSPASRVDVTLAGAHNASKVVMLAGPPLGSEARLADGNGVMVSACVENILEEAGRHIDHKLIHSP
jgi:hypothetical protein